MFLTGARVFTNGRLFLANTSIAIHALKTAIDNRLDAASFYCSHPRERGRERERDFCRSLSKSHDGISFVLQSFCSAGLSSENGIFLGAEIRGILSVYEDEGRNFCRSASQYGKDLFIGKRPIPNRLKLPIMRPARPAIHTRLWRAFALRFRLLIGQCREYREQRENRTINMLDRCQTGHVRGQTVLHFRCVNPRVRARNRVLDLRLRSESEKVSPKAGARRFSRVGD